MNINKSLHLEHILASIEELLVLSKKTAAPSDMSFQYIGTIIDNTMGLLTAPANSLNNGNLRIVFEGDLNWISLMQAVHRSFFSSIQTALEKGLSELVNNVEIINVIKIERLIKELNGKLTRSQEKLIKSFSQKKPAFNDYLESAFKQNRSMSNDRKKIWRKYFHCLSIIRNKSSHSDSFLSNNEKNILLENGFSSVVKGNELQLNSRIYAQVCNHVIQFFQEFGHKLKIDF